MPEWYEVAYKGGPMVDVPGFPRPLYPPDANEHGKKPSMNGPDVIAYKRTVSRAGRWPWQEFDDAYSNAFAHGDGPNVIDTGVAGVQRQQGIDDSGWIGEKTFNTLRSIRVPEGKPHGGEMAMDAYAQDLIAQAWEIFHGSPTPAPSGSSAAARLQLAKSQIGYKESPAGSNNNKFGSWYGMNYQPWCAMFVTWADQESGRATESFKRGSRYSYVPYVIDDAAHDRYGLHLTDKPKAGDLVCYDWHDDGVFDHIGLFEGWVHGSDYSFTAIEGNTSIDSNSNGGEVMRRTRHDDGTALFVRVEE